MNDLTKKIKFTGHLIYYLLVGFNVVKIQNKRVAYIILITQIHQFMEHVWFCSKNIFQFLDEILNIYQ